MNINFTGHQIEITPAIRNYANDKFQKIQNHFSDKITSMNVIFTAEKLQKTAEATIHVAKKEIHASSTADDLYSAIDALIDKLVKQITKYKEKLSAHRE